MPLPIPRDLREREHYHQHHEWDEQPDGLPFPIQRPSDEWLKAHRNVMYDTTENWQKSELLLRLGTIAVSYDLEKTPPHGCPPKVQTYAVKVAYKDRHGNPQRWCDLPFVQPDLTPYIHTIIEQLSAELCANFITRVEFNESNDRLSAAIDDVALSAASTLSVAQEAMMSSEYAVNVAEDAKLRIDAAVEVAEEAKEVAENAGLSSLSAIDIANEATGIAKSAAQVANEAKATADEANATASQAMLSAGNAVSVALSAYEKADSVLSTALSALDTAKDANATAKTAHDIADAAIAMADWARTMPIDTKRLYQREGFDFLYCGTATTVIEPQQRPPVKSAIPLSTPSNQGKQ